MFRVMAIRHLIILCLLVVCDSRQVANRNNGEKRRKKQSRSKDL